MAIIRVNVPDSLMEQLPRLVKLVGCGDEKDLVRYCLQEVLRQQRAFIQAEAKKERADLPPAEKSVWTKLPDPPDVQIGKKHYKDICNHLVHWQQKLGAEKFREKWGPFLEKLNWALRGQDWAQLAEWHARNIWVKPSTPEQTAYLAEALTPEVVGGYGMGAPK